jgi:tetratricopeptide (TPR) repeat protein
VRGAVGPEADVRGAGAVASPVRATRLAAAACLLALAGLVGCATGAPAQPPAPVEQAIVVPAADRPFLVPPATGFGQPLAPTAADALARGHRALLDGRLPLVRRAVAEALEAEPGLPPAIVLAAQADLLAGNAAAAVAALAPVAAERPSYVAAQLALGRAHERSDDPIAAFAAFHAVAESAPPAAERLAALLPRVVQVLSNRVDAAVRGGEIERAAQALARLQLWAPAEAATVRAAWRVAAARGDRHGELLALRELSAQHGPLDERELVERRATLELAVGDPGAGVDLYETLARAHPQDRALAERLESAKFLWRVTQLPPKVADAAAVPELDRGGFAVLLYWLVPQVRYGRAGTARIASDILDDPRREEIARVINLGLLDVDSTVHRFYPDRPLQRSRGLRALARLLGGAGTACAAGVSADPSADEACAAAVRCGLVAHAAACTATDGVSGSEALEMLRRVVDLLGGS